VAEYAYRHPIAGEPYKGEVAIKESDSRRWLGYVIPPFEPTDEFLNGHTSTGFTPILEAQEEDKTVIWLRVSHPPDDPLPVIAIRGMTDIIATLNQQNVQNIVQEDN